MSQRHAGERPVRDQSRNRLFGSLEDLESEISKLLAANSYDRMAGHKPLNAFSPDGRALASGGNDGTVRLWNLLLNEQVAVLEGHGSGVWDVAFSPDGQTLASTSLDATIKLWRASKEQ